MAYSEVIQNLIRQKEEIERFIEEKTKELKRINSAIDSLLGNEDNATRQNWSERGLNYICNHGVFVQTTDMLGEVLTTADLHDEKKRRSGLVSLSIALNNMCARGALRKIVIQGIKGHLYGLPEWFDENNRPKNEHLANLMARYGKASQPAKLSIEDLSNMTPGAGSL